MMVTLIKIALGLQIAKLTAHLMFLMVPQMIQMVLVYVM